MNVSCSGVRSHVLDLHQSACSFALLDLMMDELQQRSSCHAQALAAVELGRVCADAGDGCLTVRVDVQRAGQRKSSQRSCYGLRYTPLVAAMLAPMRVAPPT